MPDSERQYYPYPDGDPAHSHSSEKEKQRICPHHHTFCYGSDNIGFVTCQDCGAKIGMDEAFNIMMKRFEEVINRVCCDKQCDMHDTL